MPGVDRWGRGCPGPAEGSADRSVASIVRRSSAGFAPSVFLSAFRFLAGTEPLSKAGVGMARLFLSGALRPADPLTNSQGPLSRMPVSPGDEEDRAWR